MAVINSSGQWNYMGEVSRLLIASPRPRLMETFFLILFSSLIGIDVPYSFLAHDRMSVASLCNHDLSVIVVIVIIVVCEHSSWPHAWPNKVHTLHAYAAISCIVAHQKLYHSDLYLLYSSHICMFILMSIVHEVINIATSNLTETRI